MIYLLLSILCSAMISIVMRLSEGNVKSKLCMIAINYMTCFMLSWGMTGFQNPFLDETGLMATFGMGAFNGLFYMLALILGQYSIARNGVILSSVFSKMGVLVIPLLVSILFFKEVPTSFQFVGFILALASIFVLNYQKGKSSLQKKLKWSLFALLVAEGCAGIMAKVFREIGNNVLEYNFLLYTFLTAFFFCVILILIKKEWIGKKEIFYGVMIGLPNFLASRFVLLALKTVPAVVVYPAKSVATIAVISLAGVFIFKERLSRQQSMAMGVIIIALILLSL